MEMAKIRNLYPYQEQIVKYLENTSYSALFVDMRLGKTLCTIRALKDLPGRKLILCPKAVINTWCDELEAEGITEYSWFSTSELKRIKNIVSVIPAPWNIMNYEAIMRVEPKDLEDFNYIVCDESVRIAHPQAKTTKFLTQHFRNAKKRIILSGNPAPNNPLEYFSQMQFLHGEWMDCKNYWQFRQRYFISDPQGWQWWTRHSSQDAIKMQLRKDAYILSRKDVGLDNVKVYEKRVVEMPAVLRKEYDRMEKEFACKMPDGTELETSYILSQLSFLLQMAGGSLSKQKFSDFKIKELVNLLTGELKGEKVLIFCQFRWEEAEIVKALRKQQIPSDSINGDTPLERRKILQDVFNNGEFSVLIMQVATGKFGLNLSAADTVIYYSNSLKPDDRVQSEERIVRVGKTNPLLYIDLITKNTVDEQVLKALKAKDRQAKFFLGQITEEIKKKYER